MNTSRFTLLLPLVAALAVSAEARPDRLPPEGRPPRRLDGPGGEPGRNPDEMRHTLGLLFIHRARIELGLSDDQALALLPLVDKVERLRQESGQRRGRVARQLEALSEQPTAKDDEVQALVRALDQEEDRSRLEQARARDEMMTLLTPQQKARFVLFAHRFRGAVEDQVRAMRQGRPGPRRGDGPDGPGGDRDPEAPPPEP